MSLAGKKYIGGGSNATSDFFSNEESWIKVVYDFAADGGTQGDFDVLENENTSDNYVITDFFYHVETAVTPATTVVVDLGISDGGTEFLSDKASSALTLNAIGGMDTAAPVKLAASGKVVMGIESQNITAGKINWWFKLKKAI